MGLMTDQIRKLMMIEMIANTLSAILLGYFSGIAVSLLTVAQFHIFVELPVEFSLPLAPLLMVGGASIFSMVAGARLGTNILYGKSISSILKGQ